MKSLRIVVYLCIVQILFSPAVSASSIKEVFEEATLAFGNKDYDKAIALYEESLRMYPQFAPAYNFIAMSRKELGADVNEVIELYNKAISLDPNYALAYDNLGKLYYSLGKFELARDNSLKAVELRPDSITARLSLAWTYLLGLSEPSEAIVHFKNVTDRVELPYAYFGLGMAYYMDDQRLMVLDMITKLRDINEEGFARKLEAMVSEGKYVPPNIKTSLIGPSQNESMLVSDSLPSLADVIEAPDMPVRIRTKIQSPGVQLPRGEPTQLTGEDRIKSLQQNYQANDARY